MRQFIFYVIPYPLEFDWDAEEFYSKELNLRTFRIKDCFQAVLEHCNIIVDKDLDISILEMLCLRNNIYVQFQYA